MTVSASHDRERARRAALRNAAQSIHWYAGADQDGRQREWSVPRGFAVPAATVEALECARRLRALASDAPGATGFRVKLPLPLRSRTLSDYTGDVDALGEVVAAYRRASEPAAVGAR